MFDWNDVRSFLAVAEAGSTLAAGKGLRVSQTTVARRIDALEGALGLQLFGRQPSGYRLTAAGERLVDAARDLKTAADAFAEAASRQARERSEIVKLTTGDIFAATILPPILGDLREAHPAIRIDLESSYEIRDLAAGAADVAVRIGERLAGAGLVARRVADHSWTLYCSQQYAAENGTPASHRDLSGRPIIAGGEERIWRIYKQWLEAHGLIGNIVMHHDTSTGLLAAVRAGVGLAVLPCIVADSDPDLVRCLPVLEGRPRGMWLVTHERVRHVPRVRIVLDFLAKRLIPLGIASKSAGMTAVAPSPEGEFAGPAEVTSVTD